MKQTFNGSTGPFSKYPRVINHSRADTCDCVDHKKEAIEPPDFVRNDQQSAVSWLLFSPTQHHSHLNRHPEGFTNQKTTRDHEEDRKKEKTKIRYVFLKTLK